MQTKKRKSSNPYSDPTILTRLNQLITHDIYGGLFLKLETNDIDISDNMMNHIVTVIRTELIDCVMGQDLSFSFADCEEAGLHELIAKHFAEQFDIIVPTPWSLNDIVDAEILKAIETRELAYVI